MIKADSLVIYKCECGLTNERKLKNIKKSIRVIGKAICDSCANAIRKKKSNEAWKDPSRLEKLSNTIKEKRKDPEYIKHQMTKLKEACATEEHRNKVSKAVIDTWQKPKYKELKSSITKKQWEDPDYADMMSQNAKKQWEDPDYADTMARQSSDLWNNESYRKTQTSRIVDFWSIPANRDVASQNMTRLWSNIIYREEQTPKITAACNTDEFKKHMSESATNSWKNDKYREIQAIAHEEFLKSGRDSIIERVTQKILSSLGVEWTRQHRIGPWTFDIFIQSKNLLIECQGEYWHSPKDRKKMDAGKYSYINKFFPNLKILYLNENQFFNPIYVQSIIAKELGILNILEHQNEFEFSNLEIQSLSVKDKLPKSYYSAPEEFLRTFHYAGYGRSAKQTYGSLLDGKLISVCKFAGVVRKEVATSMDLQHTEVLELDRFCIHPQYQKKNFASWMLSRSSKMIFDNFPKINALVSFADSTHGHSGIIYRASNWTEIGKVKPDYHYINSEGWAMHKKTLYNHAVSMKKKEAEYAQEHGYVKVYGKEKTKFVLYRK